MNYAEVIELDNVTISDCLEWYEKRGGIVIINDGRIVNLDKE